MYKIKISLCVIYALQTAILVSPWGASDCSGKPGAQRVRTWSEKRGFWQSQKCAKKLNAVTLKEP